MLMGRLCRVSHNQCHSIIPASHRWRFVMPACLLVLWDAARSYQCGRPRDDASQRGFRGDEQLF
jgi:hypothetical protein